MRRQSQKTLTKDNKRKSMREMNISNVSSLKGKLTIALPGKGGKTRSKTLYGEYKSSEGFPEVAKLELYDKAGSKALPKAVVRVKNLAAVDLLSSSVNGKTSTFIFLQDTSSGGSRYEITSQDKTLTTSDWFDAIKKDFDLTRPEK